MRWEHACLKRVYSFTEPPAPITNTFYGPEGEKEVSGNNGVEILNTLGREGWELVTVAINHFECGMEQMHWLKRPVTRARPVISHSR